MSIFSTVSSSSEQLIISVFSFRNFAVKRKDVCDDG
jgi:hypothetical protein